MNTKYLHKQSLEKVRAALPFLEKMGIKLPEAARLTIDAKLQKVIAIRVTRRIVKKIEKAFLREDTLVITKNGRVYTYSGYTAMGDNMKKHRQPWKHGRKSAKQVAHENGHTAHAAPAP